MASPSKFFSAALEAAQKIGQRSGTGQQLKSMLRKYGAKQKELDYIGVEDAFKDDKQYRTSGLVDYITHQQVKPEEVTYSGQRDDIEDLHVKAADITDATIRSFSANSDEAREAQLAYRDLTGQEFDPGEWAEPQHFGVTPEHIAEENRPDSSEFDSMFDAYYSTVLDSLDRGAGDTRWSGHGYVSQPASDDYTEHLVTLPTPPKYKNDNAASPGFENVYHGPHWDEPNVLAHMRYDYDPDALRLEEIQSDWLQKARKMGFKWTPEEAQQQYLRRQNAHWAFNDYIGKSGAFYAPMEVKRRLPRYEELHNAAVDAYNAQALQAHTPPRAPLANVNDWTSMMLRRAMLEAAQNDKSRIRWTPGALQDARYHDNEGRAKYYDEIIPNLTSKILKPWGGTVVKPYDYEDWKPAAVATDRNPDEYWSADIPSDLMKLLQAKGKVPFFKHGGEV